MRGLLLALVASARALAPKPLNSRDVNRLVGEARGWDDVLAASTLLPLAGEETCSWEADPVHVRKRRSALKRVFAKLAQRCVGGGAAAARRDVVSDGRFARCLALLAEDAAGASDAAAAWRADRRESLRYVGALAQEPGPWAAHGDLLEAAFARAAGDGDGGAAGATALHWAARRCAARGATLPSLERLAAAEAALGLPFAVRPGLLAATLPDVGALKASLPLAAERIATKGGALVLERRHTAWVAEAGVGALAYSGKLMAPKPLPEPVAVARDALADALYGDALRHDCALLNLYAKGEKAACKYHSDPEHGTYWHRENVVVSAGEPRRFCFRKIGRAGDDDLHTFHLFHGDVVHMFGPCQDDYQHAVLAAEDDDTNDGDRVSIVFKKAIPAPGSGRLGHGVPRAATSARKAAPKAAGAAPKAAARKKPRRRRAPAR